MMVWLMACSPEPPPPVDLRVEEKTPEPEPVPRTREAGLKAALAWLAEWPEHPEHELRFDASVGLREIARHTQGPNLTKALAAADPVAERDDNNRMHKLRDPSFSLKHVVLPIPAEGRIQPDWPVIDAAYCKEQPFRPEMLAHVCGPMRDNGGYYSTHAMWALTVAVRNECIAAEDTCMASLGDELRKAQPLPLDAKVTLDLDLFAERLLMVRLAGGDEPAWEEELLRLQLEDGSWQVPGSDEPNYYAYHATLVSAWALAVSP